MKKPTSFSSARKFLQKEDSCLEFAFSPTLSIYEYLL